MQPLLHFSLALLIGLGGYFYWQRWLGKHPLPLKTVLALILTAAPLVLLGGHVAYYVTNRPAAAPFFLSLHGWSAGYHSLGSLAGIALAVLVVAWVQRLPVRYLFDLFAPAVFIVSAIWRLGCFFHGCCYGAPTDLPWGVSFPVVEELGLRTPPSHPVQLYEAGASILLFSLLPLIADRLKARPGQGLIALAAVWLYAAERFVLEVYRIGGTTEAVLAGFSLTQLIAGTALVVCGAGMLLLIRHRTVGRVGKTPI